MRFQDWWHQVYTVSHAILNMLPDLWSFELCASALSLAALHVTPHLRTHRACHFCICLFQVWNEFPLFPPWQSSSAMWGPLIPFSLPHRSGILPWLLWTYSLKRYFCHFLEFWREKADTYSKIIWLSLLTCTSDGPAPFTKVTWRDENCGSSKVLGKFLRRMMTHRSEAKAWATHWAHSHVLSHLISTAGLEGNSGIISIR